MMTPAQRRDQEDEHTICAVGGVASLQVSASNLELAQLGLKPGSGRLRAAH